MQCLANFESPFAGSWVDKKIALQPSQDPVIRKSLCKVEVGSLGPPLLCASISKLWKRSDADSRGNIESEYIYARAGTKTARCVQSLATT
eukprot:6471182-Pyramimonas_sp.AAC.1